MSQVVIEQFGKCKIRYSGLPLPNMKGILRDAQQQALIETVYKWREEFGPSHFSIQAYTQYGHFEDRVYEIRARDKRRSGYPRPPLFRSGDLKSAFLQGSLRARATGEASSLKVTANWTELPYYAYIDQYGAGRSPGPKMYLELTIMTKDQEQRLAAVFGQELMKVLDEMSEQGESPEPAEAAMAA